MDAAATLLVVGAAYWLLRKRLTRQPRVRYVLRSEPARTGGGPETVDRATEGGAPGQGSEPAAVAGSILEAAGIVDSEASAGSGPGAAGPDIESAAEDFFPARPLEAGETPADIVSEATDIAAAEAAVPDPEIAASGGTEPDADRTTVPEATGAEPQAEAAVVVPDEILTPPAGPAEGAMAAPAAGMPAAASPAADAEEAPDRAGVAALTRDGAVAVFAPSPPDPASPEAVGTGVPPTAEAAQDRDAEASGAPVVCDALPTTDGRPEPAAGNRLAKAESAPVPDLAAHTYDARPTAGLPSEPSAPLPERHGADDAVTHAHDSEAEVESRSAAEAEADRAAARKIVERFFDGRHARQASWAAVAAILAVAEGEIDDGQSVVGALEQLGIGIEPLPADGDEPPLPDGTVMLFLIPEAARRAPDAMADPDAVPGALPVDLRLAIELAAAVASSEAEPDEAGGARPLSFASLVAAVRRRSDLSGVARARALALAIATSSNQAQRGRCGARFGRMALPDREAVIVAAADLIRPEPAAWPGLEASIRRRLDPLILQAAAIDDAQRPERPKRRARPARKATAG